MAFPHAVSDRAFDSAASVTGSQNAAELRADVQRLTDAEIMAGVGHGDESSLRELQRRYWRTVVGFACALVDPDAAEDVAQETFLRASAHAVQWKPLGALRTYLLHIARNIALNERRRQRGQLATLAAAQPTLASRTTPTPHDLLDEAELRTLILAALDAMPARRREAFALIRFGGLSYAEAAAVMGTSEQTTANQMSAAMADLRRAIAPFLDESAGQ